MDELIDDCLLDEDGRKDLDCWWNDDHGATAASWKHWWGSWDHDSGCVDSSIVRQAAQRVIHIQLDLRVAVVLASRPVTQIDCDVSRLSQWRS